jgi:hypothetical protein
MSRSDNPEDQNVKIFRAARNSSLIEAMARLQYFQVNLVTFCFWKYRPVLATILDIEDLCVCACMF